MKARNLIIASIIAGLFFMAGCGEEAPKEKIGTLKSELDEIKKLEEKSKNLQTADDAFTLIRDLNKNMKNVRDAVLDMDTEYNALEDESRKKEVEQRFAKVNKQLDASLETISKNVEPYKDDERVQRILSKLHEILISK